ncbi:hypothetical protein DBR06_SOUSAS25810013, partial [Sousa chinensis]
SRNPPVTFEVCKSEQRAQLREETATWNPTTLHPQLQHSSIIARCRGDQTEHDC